MVRLAYFNQKCQEIVQQSSSGDFRDKEKTEGGGGGRGGRGEGGEDDNEKKLHTNPSSSTVLIFKLLQELVSADVSFYSTYMNRTSCFDQLSIVY